MPSKRSSAHKSVMPWAGGWVTNSQTELLNSLCPNAQYPFPRFGGLSKAQLLALEAACTHAFYAIKDYIEVLQFQKLNDTERSVYLAICRKTLGFNKLMERMSRSIFWKGQRDHNGDLALNDKGNPILPPSVRDTSALKNGLKGLIGKDFITKMAADDTRQGREGNVYAPLALHILVPKFLQEARSADIEIPDRERGKIFDVLDNRVNFCFAELLNNAAKKGENAENPPRL